MGFMRGPVGDVDLEDLGGIARGHGVGRIAGAQGRVLAPCAVGRRAFTRKHESNGVRRQLHRCAGRQPDDGHAGLALGEHAQQLAPHARDTGLVRPGEIVGVHEHRLRVLAVRVLHAPAVDVLPHGFVRVLVLAAAVFLDAAEHAALESAELLEFLHALLEALLGDVAAAAGAAELQHQRGRFAADALRAVEHAFGEVADGAGPHHAVAREVGVALQLHAHLVEVVAVPRRVEVGIGKGQLQEEVFRRAFGAVQQGLRAEQAGARVLAFQHRHVGEVDERFHLNGPSGALRRRAGRAACAPSGSAPP
ncbi:hypothetical protein HK414_04965 [Ramlibacter terrae]|uniref:Uncharacterized protein n=1 Tax=Ramlibacter terrae TaxID=2732511 RepID=A0ABX6P0Q0_9BURK|nr:hypothetical protein HK414_04965 [Ramlibacter terrae]